MEIGALTKLRRLSIASNLLKSLPDTIGDLKSLQICYLHDNMLWSIPSTFAHLDALQTSHIHGNVLTGLPHGAPREDGIELRDFFKWMLNRDDEALAFESVMLEKGADAALTEPDTPFSHCLPTFMQNQHRLESVIRDGGALINPRIFWCGWCREVLVLPAVSGRWFLDAIILHWNSTRHVFNETGPVFASTRLQQLVDDEETVFPFPFNRREVDFYMDDEKEYNLRLAGNQRQSPKLNGYMPCREALVSPNRELLRGLQACYPELEEQLIYQKMLVSGDCAPTVCLRCSRAPEVDEAWKTGDERLAQDEYKTCEDSKSVWVHQWVHRCVLRPSPELPPIIPTGTPSSQLTETKSSDAEMKELTSPTKAAATPTLPSPRFLDDLSATKENGRKTLFPRAASAATSKAKLKPRKK